MAEELPLFPLNTVLFPGMALPLHIFEYRYREMIGLCSEESRPFGVVLIREGMEVGAPATPFDVGTMAKIVGVDRLPDGGMNIMTIGTQRFRILRYSTEKKPYIVGDVEVLEDQPGEPSTASDLASAVGALAQRYATMLQALSEQPLTPLRLPSSPEEISYLVGAVVQIRNLDRQQLLELMSAAERLQREKEILERENQRLEQLLTDRGGGVGPFSRN
jgi:Lon protease-like protein